MSHFYAPIRGSRGEATRRGTKASGITGHIRGWRLGARVALHHNTLDHLTLSITAGSSDPYKTPELGTWTRDSFGNLQPHDSRAAAILTAIRKEQEA